MYQIVFYEAVSGRKVVTQFISSLDKFTQSKVTRQLNVLQSVGPKITSPQAKYVTKNLFELRIRGKVEVRVIYSFVNKKILILHGFIKKTMKIPQKEITTSITRLEQYLL